MLNAINFVAKVIKYSNERELDRLAKIVTKINALEAAAQ